MSKILVTGGTGFLGSALVRKLVHAGHEVRVLDNQSRGNTRRIQDVLSAVELIEADIRDQAAVFKACLGVDRVCHLAFINGTEFFYSQPELVLDVGVTGMLNVLKGCIEAGVRDLVVASSSEVYQTPPYIPTDETVPFSIPDPFNPRYSYAGGKIISELMTIHYGKKFFDRAILFRPHNVYGPDMGLEHVIPAFCLRMREMAEHHVSEAVEFEVQGTGAETRSFIYIDDFIEGLMCVMEKGNHLEVYNIGTMDETSIRELAVLMAPFFRLSVKILPTDLRLGSTLRRCPDTKKINALGFKAKTSLQEGIAKTIPWYDEYFKQVAQASKTFTG